MHEMPESCPVRRLLCPRRFYVFMENRKSNTTSSIASGVNTEVRKIKKDPASPAGGAFQDLDKFVAAKVSNENDFFTLFEVDPVYDNDAGKCSCAYAALP